MYKYTYSRATDSHPSESHDEQTRIVHFCGDIIYETDEAAASDSLCYKIIRGSWPTFIVKVMPDGYVPPRTIHTKCLTYKKHGDSTEQLGDFTRTITRIQLQDQSDYSGHSNQLRRQESRHHPRKKQQSAEHRYHPASKVSGHHSQQRMKNESRP